VHGGAGPAEDLRGGLGVHFGSGSAAAQPEIDDDGGSTPLATLNSRFGRVLGPGECQIGLSQVRPSRAKLLDCKNAPPALLAEHSG
jgi:GntR family transcriptional regulator